MIHFFAFLRDAIIERFYCYNWFYDSLAKNLELFYQWSPDMKLDPAYGPDRLFPSKRVFVILWFWNDYVAIRWAPIRFKHSTDKCVYPMTTIDKCNIHPRKGQSLTICHFYLGSPDVQTFRSPKFGHPREKDYLDCGWTLRVHWSQILNVIEDIPAAAGLLIFIPGPIPNQQFIIPTTRDAKSPFTGFLKYLSPTSVLGCGKSFFKKQP